MKNLINPKTVSLALSLASGDEFEAFCNAFLPSLEGKYFIPLGKYKDGGADAYLESEHISEDKNSKNFYQASIEENYKGKIRRTIERLQAVGRSIKSLTYLSSKPISSIDLVERELSEELNIAIRIRSSAYFENHINNTSGTKAAFLLIKHHLDILGKPGASNFIPRSPDIINPTLYVFLRQELEERSGERLDLLNGTIDSLILWALDETDPNPENPRLMPPEEILEKILNVFPALKESIRRNMNKRLELLSSKRNPGGRKINFHSKENAYCLPYETRQIITDENIVDITLQDEVVNNFCRRIIDFNIDQIGPERAKKLSLMALKTIQKTFELEGMSFCAFLENGENNDSYLTIGNQVDIVLNEESESWELKEKFRESILRCLQKAFYESTEAERLLFSKLSKTYSLFFSLKIDHKIIEHFDTISSNFRLLVGSDLLVRSLTERYLDSDDQMTTNMLKLVKDSGAELILTEAALDKIHTHLRAMDMEFRNHYSDIENHVTPEIARNSRYIIIRSYFYSKFNINNPLGTPKSWGEYIQQFCDYSSLHKNSGKESLKQYLLRKFRMVYMPMNDLKSLIKDQEEFDELKEKLRGVKTNDQLAITSALIINAVYSLRHQNNEVSYLGRHGYCTWCITNEKKILTPTNYLIKKKGTSYILRPEFLLNFISLAPNMNDVRNSYRNIFPTLLGIRLANRVEESVLKEILKKIKEAREYEPERIEAIISQSTDQLKSNFTKTYDVNIDDEEFFYEEDLILELTDDKNALNNRKP